MKNKSKNIKSKITELSNKLVPPEKLVETIEKSANFLLYLSFSLISIPFIMFLLEFIVVKNRSTNNLSKYLFNRGSVVFGGDASSLIIIVMTSSIILGLYLLILDIIIYAVIKVNAKNKISVIIDAIIFIISIVLTVGFIFFDGFRLDNIFFILALWVVAIWVIYNLIKIILELSKEKTIELFIIPILAALVGYLFGK